MRSATIVEEMSVSKSDANIVYALTSWPRSVLVRTESAGRSWSEPLLETKSNDVAVKPDDPDTVWVVDPLGLLESEDGGKSWQRVSTLRISDLDVSADAPDRPCAAGYSSEGGYLVCRETAGWGQEFHWVQQMLPSIPNAVRFSVSPTNRNWMMTVGKNDDTFNFSVFTSQDNGQSWQKVFQGPDDYWILDLFVAGGKPSRLIAVYFEYHPDNLLVYESLDGGESWHDITHQLAESGGEMWTGWTYKAPVLFDEKGVTYFATRGVVLQQLMDGQSWEVVRNDVESVHDMVILSGAQESLLISTEYGLYELHLPIYHSFWMPIIRIEP